MLIIEDIQNLEILKALFEDKCMNGMSVMDTIASHDLIDLLENPILDNLISHYWTGPYEL